MAEPFSFTSAVLAEVAKWGVPLAGGLVAVFFTPAVEQIRVRLSRAELRVKQYEEFAMDVSALLFQAELQHEFLSSDWATPDDHNEITDSYNAAITTFRTKELVYLAWAARYWRPKELPEFQAILEQVRSVDSAIHAFNDENEAALTERLRVLKQANDSLRTAVLALLAPAALAPSPRRAQVSTAR